MRSISVASDGSYVVAANNSGNCFVWEPNSSKDYVPKKRFQGHDAYILKCSLSPDVRYLATASSDHTVKLWNVQDDFSLDKTLAAHQRWVWDCVFSADSEYLVTGSSDQTARLLDINRGEVIKNYTGHNKAVVCVALNDSSVGE